MSGLQHFGLAVQDRVSGQGQELQYRIELGGTSLLQLQQRWHARNRTLLSQSPSIKVAYLTYLHSREPTEETLSLGGQVLVALLTSALGSRIAVAQSLSLLQLL